MTSITHQARPRYSDDIDVPPVSLQEHQQEKSRSGRVVDVEEAKHASPSASMLSSRRVVGWKWIALVVSTLSGVFLYALDNTVLANSRPPIIEDLGHIEKLPWLSVGFNLGSASLAAIWPKAYTLFDNKVLFCLATLLFNVGTVLCGAAPNMNAVIIGRVIGGAGGAGLYSGSMQILSSLALPSERALYTSFAGLAWTIGTLVGPLIGGAFSDSSATWRWAFYLIVCLGGLVAPGFLLFLPSNPSRLDLSTHSTSARLRNFDFVGSILLVGSTTMLTMAISFGGVIWAWDSSRIVGLFCGSGIVLILFTFQQWYSIFTSMPYRLLSVEFFTSSEIAVLFPLVMVGMIIVIIPVYFLPLLYQFTRDDSALEAGVKKLPHIGSCAVALVLSSVFYKKFPIAGVWFASGGTLALIGAGLMTMVDPKTSNADVYGFTMLMGLGAGLFAQLTYPVAHESHPTIIPKTTAFLTFGQSFGLALGIDIGTSIFMNLAQNRISRLAGDLTRNSIQAMISGTESTTLQGVDGDLRANIIAAIVRSIRDVYIFAATLAGLVILLSVIVARNQRRLRGKASGY